jgi:hypothetical protein
MPKARAPPRWTRRGSSCQSLTDAAGAGSRTGYITWFPRLGLSSAQMMKPAIAIMMIDHTG